MGSTPTYGLPFPETTDPADVPTDMHELALEVEAELGTVHTELNSLDSRMDALEAQVGGFVLLQQQILGAPSGSIDLLSISAAYSSLMLTFTARSDGAVGSTALNMRLNNDSGGNYDVEGRGDSGTTTTAPSEDRAQTLMLVGSVPGASAGASRMGSGMLLLPAYSATVGFQTVCVLGGRIIGTATGDVQVATRWGSWRSAAAVNRLTLLPATGSFIAGSRATLYGLR